VAGAMLSSFKGAALAHFTECWLVLLIISVATVFEAKDRPALAAKLFWMHSGGRIVRY